ncbi:phage antirepressor KilAC domain-containing protein [Aeromonas salmonicida]|uniref:phage antirepressor KilAC domain-containing protein n=1 Tax=Aeromonas salmonicida TaxID=645 RepID=UPI002330C92C|nr:phage antirepressor KilAC domain-containing protein [Aeromonas salmonicida]WCH25933.1 phage antirepressor KilAC domain-containing protein [Aeromonas salmonicida]
MTNLISKAFEGHSIRIITDEQGEPWFVAKDVAAALGYKDTDKAIRTHCKAAKTYPAEMAGQIRHLSVIPERDVYRLIMRSKLESAEHFEEWVVGEVLPSIRKRGGYIAGQEQDTPELIMAKALMVAQSVIESKTIELQRAKEQIAIQAPKADFADRVAGADKGVLLGNFAKTVGIGPKKIFAILREMRILMKGGNRHNLLFQQYLDLGYFEVIEKPYEINGETRLAFSPTITGKGQQWLTHKLLAAGHLQAHAA